MISKLFTYINKFQNAYISKPQGAVFVIVHVFCLNVTNLYHIGSPASPLGISLLMLTCVICQACKEGGLPRGQVTYRGPGQVHNKVIPCNIIFFIRNAVCVRGTQLKSSHYAYPCPLISWKGWQAKKDHHHFSIFNTFFVYFWG